MPTTLIILAHPERRSFNGAWAEESARQSTTQGQTVLWSDLNAMGFDPAESAKHYRAPAVPFDPLKAQENAAFANSLPDTVQTEIAKITKADRLIFHFPIWWFGPPAILKGWCERVLAHGALHTVDERFDNGRCIGKKAMFCVTAGAQQSESAHNGKEGDVQMLLWPLAYTLRYLGMTVLQPKVCSGVHGYFKEEAETELKLRLSSVLKKHADTIKDFDSLPSITFNSDRDFDSDGRLKPEAPSHSHFIRHDP